MPIRPENKARYPKDWPAISARTRERAGQRCEECGVENYALGGRLPDGRWLKAQPTGDDGLRLTWPQPGEHAWCGSGDGARRLRVVRIILTVAHLDHQPENCEPENLRAWCQRCHNRYDAKARRDGIRERSRLQAAAGDLFNTKPVS
jgi:hypothetical protein